MVGRFAVDGSLYTKQVASYPVDVIVVEGRGKSQRDLPEVITSYEQRKEKLNGANRVGTNQNLGTDRAGSGANQDGEGDGTGLVGGAGRPGDANGENGAAGRNDVGLQNTGPTGDGRADGGRTVPSGGQSQPADTPDAGSRQQGVPGESTRQTGSQGSNRNDGLANLGGSSQVSGQRVESGLTDRRGQEQETATRVSHSMLPNRLSCL